VKYNFIGCCSCYCCRCLQPIVPALPVASSIVRSNIPLGFSHSMPTIKTRSLCIGGMLVPVILCCCDGVTAFTSPSCFQQHPSLSPGRALEHTNSFIFHQQRHLSPIKTTNPGRTRRGSRGASVVDLLPMRLTSAVKAMHSDSTFVLTAILWLSTFGISLEKRTTVGKALSVGPIHEILMKPFSHCLPHFFH
jgi:hypothetical protein